uniref:Sugar phosphate transporter domain-containing protein n=1 Tax=Entomoneis paludosa TaxID=265537 RepID=A0A7S2Y3K8_9STRA
MIKSCTPIFVLFWAYLFGITRITPQLIGVVVLITAGEFITVAGEVDQGDFQFTGFILCLSAAVLSGARWTLVQLKIQSLQPPLKTTIATMRLLSPSMFLSLLAASLMIEQPWYRLGSSMNFAGAIEIISLGLFGAIFAIAMILCEFYLIMKANAIVLAVGGVIKEVITIFVGVLFFGDRFTLRSFFGCCVIFAGVIMYKFTFTKEKERKKELLARRHLGQSGASSNKPSMGADSDETSISTAGTGTSKEEKRGLLSKMMGSGIHNSNHPPSLSPGRDGLLRSHGGNIDHDEADSLSQKDGLMRTSLKSGGAESDGWVVMPDDMGGIEMGDKSSNKTSGSGFPELKIV